MIFEHRFHIGWAHLDANRHLRSTAYQDLAADVRLMYFAQAGFSTTELARYGLDPVIRSDQID
ncbi:MAG TPA: hypothetical protein VH879_05915 [Gemmatimonadales bacterium]|jgi:acyl-CoA thioester hydrolase